jgi:hypothetical protein
MPVRPLPVRPEPVRVESGAVRSDGPVFAVFRTEGAVPAGDAAAGALSGASPQVSQYPSTMVPGQLRWHCI